MAKCFDVVGYVEPCNAVRQKYTGRALLIAYYEGEGGATFTFDKSGLVISDLDGVKSFSEFKTSFEGSSGSLFPLIINAQNPFGVTIQGNTDSGRVMYTKTIQVSIPAMHDGKAEEFIMGLINSRRGGSVYIALETLGSEEVVCDFFGAYSPVRIDPTSVTRSEYENGGAWTFNVVCEEPLPNVLCKVTGLGSLLSSLDA